MRDTSPGSTFKVDDGMILNTGSPHGYMYPLKKFWNFTLRLQYRFEPYPGMESDDDLFTNTGYLLFITKHDVWPRTLEVQENTISKCRSPWAETNRHIRLMTPRARGLANQRGNGTRWRSSLRMASSGHT